ncbi:MAG TPA: hypothetical protein VF450_05670 [Noviherbaspirillum sp.]|jgi:palmitoyl transferase
MPFLRLYLLLFMLFARLPAFAQEDEAPHWLQVARRHAAAIADEGKKDLYLSGYIHHGRHTYTAERISEFNEKDAWGLGFGKTLRNGSGNDESLYVLGINDSHYKLQWMAGYAYMRVWPLGHSGFEASAGVTAQMMSRSDYFGGFPFPVALPVAALGTRRAKLFFSYVPRLSGNKGNGDVLFMFGRIQIE